MTKDRLSTLDAECRHLEDGVEHLRIAGVCVFEGPGPRLPSCAAWWRADSIDTAPGIDIITSTAREELEAMVVRAQAQAPAASVSSL